MVPKKILCFISSLKGGGAERQMLELIKVLVNHNYSVTLLTYVDNDDYKLPHGVKRINISANSKLILLLKLIYKIRILSPDFTISFLSQNNLVACLSTFPYKKGKLIVSERNLRIKFSIYERLLYSIYKRSDFVVSNSYSQNNFIKEHSTISKNKLLTITNYTDTNRFIPMKINIKSNKIKVGIFARYTYQKNPMLLVETAKRLLDLNINIFEFHWFGNNKLENNSKIKISDSYMELKNAIIYHKLSDIIFLHDFSKNIDEDINHMDVISLFSVYEGFPNSISEGLSCGKAIIASSVSDIPILVEEEKNGFLFESDNVDSAVSSFIKYMQLSLKDRIKMSELNRQKALSLFSLKKFSEQYLNLLK